MIRLFLRSILILVAAVACFAAAAGQPTTGRLIPNPVRNIPKWIRAEMSQRNFESRYTITYQRYPVTIRGNFFGDGNKDVAVQIEERSSGKEGIAIFHPRKPQAVSGRVAVVGAGTSVGKNLDDFGKMTTWAWVRKSALGGELHHPSGEMVKSDLIKLQTADSSVVYIYWNGKQHALYGPGR